MEIVVLDPHRAGHELLYHPGETNFPRAQVLVVNKIDSAMGYSPGQLNDLAETIAATPCDTIVVATPVDLARLIQLPKPHCRVRYDLAEIGKPDLADIVNEFLHVQGRRISLPPSPPQAVKERGEG